MTQYKSRNRRINREKNWINKEFNSRIELFIEDFVPLMEDSQGEKFEISRFYPMVNEIEQLIFAHNELWDRYVENVRANPKYNVSPKDEDMFINRANYLVVAYFFAVLGMNNLKIRTIFPEMMCEKHFVDKIQEIICDGYQQKEVRKILFTEIQKNTFFSGILNLVNWFVSFLKRK